MRQFNKRATANWREYRCEPGAKNLGFFAPVRSSSHYFAPVRSSFFALFSQKPTGAIRKMCNSSRLFAEEIVRSEDFSNFFEHFSPVMSKRRCLLQPLEGLFLNLAEG